MFNLIDFFNNPFEHIWKNLTEPSDFLKSNLFENKYEIIFNETRESVLLADHKTHKLIFANKAFLQLFGYNSEELTKLTILDLHPPEFLKTARNEFKNASKEKSNLHSNIPFLTKNKNLIFADIKDSVIKLNHKLYNLAFITDVTHRKELSDRLLYITENIPELIFEYRITKQKEIVFTYINNAVQNFLGIDYPTIKKENYKFKSFIYEEDKEMLENLIENSIQLNRPWKSNFRIHNAQKGLIWVEFYATPKISFNGNTTWYGYMHNTTEYLLIQNELSAAKNLAETTTKTKSLFLANMSHEIRTPLNGVIGFSDLMMKTNLDTIQKQYMTFIYNSSRSLMDLINSILDFSKIEAGKLELNIQYHDFLEVIEASIDYVKINANKKNLEVLLEISPNIPKFLYFDSLRVKQILINLLSNSIKFTNRGFIKLKVHLEYLDTNKKQAHLKIYIIDSGTGITKENLEKLFQSFQQADSSISTKFGGTGLGLSISKSLLQMMNSDLNVRSIPNYGTIFYFSIEFDYENSESLFTKKKYPLKKILLIEPNKYSRISFEKMLKNLNLEINSISNMNQLKNLDLNHWNTDAILFQFDLDKNTTAFDFINDYENKPLIPFEKIILYHNSNVDYSFHKKCEDLGILHKLTKPINILSLSEKIYHFNDSSKIESIKPFKNYNQTLSLNEVNILIVEDVLINQILAKSMLQKLLPKARILIANDGKESLEKMIHFKPKIIFMDLQMPILNGYEATQEIRKNDDNKETPIIALTAGTIQGEKENCIKVGMNDYMSKPFVLEDLKTILKKWIGKSL